MSERNGQSCTCLPACPSICLDYMLITIVPKNNIQGRFLWELTTVASKEIVIVILKSIYKFFFVNVNEDLKTGKLSYFPL